MRSGETQRNPYGRQLGKVGWLTQYTVRTAPLKGLHYRSLKPHFFQELFPEDCDRGTELSEITLAWKGNNSKRAENSLWTDDATLNAGDFVKPHNCHYWADHDPSMTQNAIETLSNCVV